MTINWQAVAAVVAAIGVALSGYTTFRIYRETAKLSRRRDLIPIWKEMAVLRSIDSQNPNDEDVHTSLNLLGLVAQCHKLGIVEQKAMKEMFGSAYVSVYNDIFAVSQPVTVGTTTKPGRDFLQDYRGVTDLYQKWSKE